MRLYQSFWHFGGLIIQSRNNLLKNNLHHIFFASLCCSHKYQCFDLIYCV